MVLRRRRSVWGFRCSRMTQKRIQNHWIFIVWNGYVVTLYASSKCRNQLFVIHSADAMQTKDERFGEEGGRGGQVVSEPDFVSLAIQESDTDTKVNEA